MSRSKALPSLISRTNSGRLSADSRQFSLSMLKIRSDRLSCVPSRLTLTKISRTSASDFRSGLSPGRSSSMTDTLRMFGFFVRTSSNRARFMRSLSSSSSPRVTCCLIRFSSALRSLTPAANRSETLTKYFDPPFSDASGAPGPVFISACQQSNPSLSRNSKSYFSSDTSSDSRPLNTSK